MHFQPPAEKFSCAPHPNAFAHGLRGDHNGAVAAIMDTPGVADIVAIEIAPGFYSIEGRAEPSMHPDLHAKIRTFHVGKPRR